MEFNKKFPVLSIIAKILFAVGIFVCAVGVIFGILELIELIKYIGTRGGEWYWGKSDIRNIIWFISAGVGGVIIMAIAECIGVLFAIENNTRKIS